MLCFPNCKINLGLYITGKRTDGYHNLETVFYPVQLKDALEVVPGQATKLYLSGRAVAGNEDDNLVMKAYRLLQSRFPGSVPPLDIYLHKALPMGAGLGGGSADGAFMLSLVNEYCSLGLSKEQLAEAAIELGSDCPFFIYNTPQFAGGRGEALEAVDIDLSTYSLVVVCPGIHVSTARAFSMLSPKTAAFDLRKLPELPVAEWRDTISNDFEGPIFREHPVLAEIKNALYDRGAIYASMSGSGSALYGIFPKGELPDLELAVGAEVFYV